MELVSQYVSFYPIHNSLRLKACLVMPVPAAPRKLLSDNRGMDPENIAPRLKPARLILMEEIMAKEALKNLYIEELRDLYDAENRLVKALPKLAKAAESDELRAGFEEHLEQTKGHVDRLRQIFESLDERPGGKKCAAMIGLIQEDQDILDEDFEDGVKDAALISAAQRVEHYEIAAYGCVKTWAGLLGETEAQSLLAQTLNEEKETDEKLTDLSADINLNAMGNDRDRDSTLEEFETEKEGAIGKPLKFKSRGAGSN